MSDPIGEWADRFISIERRLHALETAPSLPAIASANTTTDVEFTTYDEWTNPGDLPNITLETGSQAIIFYGVEVFFTGWGSNFKSQGGSVGVGVNGEEPQVNANNASAEFWINGDVDTAVGLNPLAVSSVALFTDLIPGENTFQILGFLDLTNGGGSLDPQFTDPYIFALPLSWG